MGSSMRTVAELWTVGGIQATSGLYVDLMDARSPGIAGDHQDSKCKLINLHCISMKCEKEKEKQQPTRHKYIDPT